jgi:hypothetical protein
VGISFRVFRVFCDYLPSIVAWPAVAASLETLAADFGVMDVGLPNRIDLTVASRPVFGSQPAKPASGFDGGGSSSGAFGGVCSCMGGSTSPLTMLIGGAGALVMGTLFKYRVLPFLKHDTILSGGRQVPTAEFAAFGARWFCIFGIACVIGSLIWVAIRARKKTA